MRIRITAHAGEAWQVTQEAMADKGSWPSWLADLWGAHPAAPVQALELQRGNLVILTEAGAQGVMVGNWIVRLEGGAVLVMTDIVVAALTAPAAQG